MSDDSEKTAHWRRVDRCFDEILDAPSHERAAALAAMVGKYPRSVVDEVRELVESLDATHSILAEPAPLQVDVAGAVQPSPPERMGRWRIGELLGSGGQGQVYRATKQAEQFEQTGALKILSDHLGPEAMQRFLKERQTLAGLRHPNIALLLDAGAGDDGRPYLVSEMIRGRTLDRYIDSEKPSNERCVKLLLLIVEAVAHAHQQFVLHRDIKPANVIVDEDGVPYLLDFGVSAAIADSAGAAAGEGGGVAPYTPTYAAPEQIRNEAVDVRTDCWALGALLYRALAGRNPFGADTAERTIHAVLHAEPEPPSNDPELNAIVAQCLQKSIDARYADVGQLRDDLRAWLADAPVRAAANSRRYLAGKWLRRHRALAVSGVLVALSLVVGAGVATHQAQRAAEQRDRAEAAAGKYRTAMGLLVDVFNGANPALQRGEAVSAEDLLAEAYARVTGMERQAGVRAALAHELAAVFVNRGEATRAARLATYARDHFESVGETASELYANTLVILASAEKIQGRYDRALQNLRRSLQVQRDHLWSASDWRYAYTQNMLGSIHTRMGSHGRAAELHRAAMGTLGRSPDAPDWLQGTAVRNYWDAQLRLGRATEARRALVDWIDEHVPGAPEEPSAYVHASLGEIALLEARYRDAQTAYAEAGRLMSAVYGQGHRDVLLYRDRTEYAAILAAGEVSADARERLLVLQDQRLENDREQARVQLAMVNHRLSLTPYLARGQRAAWLSEQQQRRSSTPYPARLARHEHLLLVAVSASAAGRDGIARDALRRAESAALYDTPQSQWQRDVQELLTALLRRTDEASCRALHASLEQPYSVELAVAARGLSCSAYGQSRSAGPANESAIKAVLE